MATAKFNNRRIFVEMSKRRQIFLHTVVWLVVLLFFVFIGARTSTLYQAIIIFAYFGIVNIAIFYTHSLYILPTFLNSRRYFACVLAAVALILSSTLLKSALAYLFKDVVLIRDNPPGSYISFSEYFLGSALTGTFFTFISTAYKFTADWFLNEKIRRNLENEKLSAELAFLKSQVNPHFLFNSLNNIYSLAYQHSEKTAEAILKLSEMMRYMLQESNEAKVDLCKELRYLDNYIELQKLRFKDHAFISLQIAGDEGRYTIAPLILIAFVENAFKHGVVSDPENPIKLIITVRKARLKLSIENKKSQFNKDLTSGVGLNNVRRRLDLLYDSKYTLNVSETDFHYYCQLSLDL